MKIQFVISLLLLNLNIFGQDISVETFSLSDIKLCELTLSDLKDIDKDLYKVDLIEMSLCPDGFVQDSRFENRKGYISKLYPNIIFQTETRSDLISKIRLTKNFKGKLPDGTYLDISKLTAKKVIEKYPKLDAWKSKGCSEYWTLTDEYLFFYVSIEMDKKPRYPIDEKYYLSKPIQGVDIILNCYNINKKKEKVPLIILDGKEVSRFEIENYDSEKIESITILKDTAVEKYGEKGKDGVIIVKLKKEKKINKKEKRKNKMMKALAEEFCAEFSDIGHKIDYDFKNSVIKILTRNHKKINKYYNTLEHEGLELFITEFMDEIMSRCDEFRKFINKKT